MFDYECLGVMLRKALQTARERHEEGLAGDDRGILSEIRLIGAGLVLLLVMVLVLTEVYDAIEIADTDPFYGVVESLETTGAAAMTLLVVGLLVVAAMAIMRFFNGSAIRGGR